MASDSSGSSLKWHEPLDYARHLVLECGVDALALLYSGLATSYSGRYSYLAWGVDAVSLAREAGSDAALAALKPVMQEQSALPHWFGTIGYEALLPECPKPLLAKQPAPIAFPHVRFVRYLHVLRFDHQYKRLEYGGPGLAAAEIPQIAAVPLPELPNMGELRCLMPARQYQPLVEEALDRIRAGQFYQVNLTRKWLGEAAETLSPAQILCLFDRLCDASPAPYSACILHEGEAVLSSSPELFLRSDQVGQLTTRPIKGTAPHATSPDALVYSIKDRSENLMIVDLMRNDLARCAVVGSVEVPDLYALDRFATLHHLSSTVQAKRRPECSLADVLAATLPPGSMTGAPKIAAMEWIAAHEPYQRGVYSGVLGWISGQACELSVVIRTIVMRGAAYEFQAGGAIVADSKAALEYEETHTKIRALLQALDCDIPK